MAIVEVDGIRFPAKPIGKGQYSRVYQVGSRAVYYTRGDCSKEVLAMFQYDRIAHLPEMVRHRDIVKKVSYGGKWGTVHKEESRWYVFSSPIYKNVTKSYPSAYRLMNDIIAVYKEFWDRERDYQYQAYGRVHSTIKVMQDFVQYASEMKAVIPRSVIRALQEIVNVASNCGGIVAFDLHKKNFGVNEYGTLIFRDPFYVMEN